LDHVVLHPRDHEQKSAFIADVDVIKSDTVLGIWNVGLGSYASRLWKRRTKKRKGCVSEHFITMNEQPPSELAYFALQLILKATNAGQTKLGTCSWYSIGKFLQCRIEIMCFCLTETKTHVFAQTLQEFTDIDASLMLTVSQHPL
jgi:hypothetical protein